MTVDSVNIGPPTRIFLVTVCLLSSTTEWWSSPRKRYEVRDHPFFFDCVAPAFLSSNSCQKRVFIGTSGIPYCHSWNMEQSYRMRIDYCFYWYFSSHPSDQSLCSLSMICTAWERCFDSARYWQSMSHHRCHLIDMSCLTLNFKD